MVKSKAKKTDQGKPVARKVSNNIEELVWVDPKTLDDNPLNWKTHPQSQRLGLQASITADGWAGALLYNRVTGRLLDGHGRKQTAIKAGWDRVPVLFGSWTEEAERRILQTLDPLGSMFVTEKDKLDNLNRLVEQGQQSLRKHSEQTRKDLESLQGRMNALPSAIESGTMSASPLPLSVLTPRKKSKAAIEPEEDEESSEEVEDSEKNVVPEDTIFGADNPWGIPDLDPAMLAPATSAPTATYDRSEVTTHGQAYYCFSARPFQTRDRLNSTGGVLGFFCEDWRFETSYQTSQDFYDKHLHGKGWSAVLSPDFSTYASYPLAMNMWQLYRSRWVSRVWQAYGVKVIPTLSTVMMPVNDALKDYLSSLPWWLKSKQNVGGPGWLDIGAATIPVGTPIIATQCRTITQQGGSFKDFAKWLTERIQWIRPQVVVIYGGLEHSSKFLGYLPKQSPKLKYCLLKSFIAARRGFMKKSKQDE